MSDGVLPFPGGPAVPPQLVAAVEALLFAAGAPVRLDDLATALPEVERGEVEAALRVLGARYDAPGHGLALVRVAGGYQLRSHEDFGDLVAALTEAKPVRLSRAALEVLAITAYEQPVTKGDIDHVRGVDSGATLRSLLQRGLIRVAGRRAVPGRPLEYRTTTAFLQLMSLEDLRSLPTLAEAEALGGDGPEGAE